MQADSQARQGVGVGDVMDGVVMPLQVWGKAQNPWWRGVRDKLVKLLQAMGVWIDDDAFPKEVAYFVIMKGFVRKVDGKEVPVTAFQFFHAFKEGKIIAINPGSRPVDPNDGTKGTIVTVKPGPRPIVTFDEKHQNQDMMVITETEPLPDASFVKKDGNLGTKPIIHLKISDVRDKGKSSVLAKLIICGQVGWMVLQLIGRRVSQLPMTLLELHTLIHIIIAVIIFWLWWYKPLDVGEPIVLDMHVPTQEDPKWSVRPKRFQSTGIRQVIDYLWLLPQSEIAYFHGPVELKTDSNPINSGTPVDEGETAPVVAQLNLWRWIMHPFRGSAMINPTKNPVTPDDASSRSEEFKNWKAESVHIIWENTFPCIFYFVYAGLHAVVWSEYFSTQAEQWFWRGACLVIGIAPSLVVFVVIMFGLIDLLTGGSGTVKDVQSFLQWSMYIIYLLASIGLVIEALVSLRRLPVDAYDTVIWTAYIPHF